VSSDVKNLKKIFDDEIYCQSVKVRDTRNIIS